MLPLPHMPAVLQRTRFCELIKILKYWKFPQKIYLDSKYPETFGAAAAV